MSLTAGQLLGYMNGVKKKIDKQSDLVTDTTILEIYQNIEQIPACSLYCSLYILLLSCRIFQVYHIPLIISFRQEEYDCLAGEFTCIVL